MGYEDNTLRRRIVPALLKKKGRIKYNEGGERVEWRIKVRRVPMVGYADMQVINFARHDRFIRANIDYRGYIINDSMSEKEMLMNKGKAAVIKYYSELLPNIATDMEEQFGEEFYVDGNAAGNELRFHGIESFMGNSGAAAGGFVGTPSDTYAGLSTVLGAHGGSVSSGTWPEAILSSDQTYDSFSPLIIDYTDSSWGAGADTWAEGAQTHMRYGIIWSNKNKSETGNLDLILLNSQMYRQFLDKLETKERIVVSHGKQDSPLVAIGYKDTVNFDGVDVTWEYGIPATSSGGSNDVGVGYGFNTSNMTLRILGPRLFDTKGPYFNEETLTSRFLVNMFGNFTFNPRSFVKFMQIT